MKRICILLMIICCEFTAEKLYADDFYWIGGSGNWNDIAHWGLFDGAQMNNGESYNRQPTANDNVIFNDNSGFTSTNRTVTLNALGYCHDMRWEGTTVVPIFTMNYNLEIAGSLFLQPGMTINNVRTISFGSSSSTEDGNYTITTNNVLLNSPLVFQGNSGGVGVWTTVDTLRSTQGITVSGGTWKAGDSVNVTRNITFSGGNIDWSGQNIAIGSFTSNYATTRNLNLQNAYVFLMGGNTGNNTTNNAWIYKGANSYLSAAGSTIEMNRISNSTIILQFDVNNTHSYNRIILGVAGAIISSTNPVNNTYSIPSGLTTDTLILRSNTNITNNTTFRVNKLLEAQGCVAPFTLSSGATIDMGSTGMTNVNSIHIQNTRISGSSSAYPASSCSDLGGNSGWNFVSGVTYWVEGAGNWNDPLHWASSSGSTPGSGCIPTAGVNVVFDENSGFHGQANRTVTVNTAAYCHNMTWHNMTGLDKPTLLFDNYNLYIYGSLELQQGMTVRDPLNRDNLGIRFRATHAVAITTNGVLIDLNSSHRRERVFFEGTGPYTIADDFNLTGGIYFVSGTLIMSGINCRLGTFQTTNALSNANALVLDIRNSTITLNSYSYNESFNPSNMAWLYYGSNATLYADNSHIIMNGNVWNGNHIAGMDKHLYNKITFLRSGQIMNDKNNNIIKTMNMDSLIMGGVNDSLSIKATTTVNKYFEAVACRGVKRIGMLSGSGVNNLVFGTNIDVNVDHLIIDNTTVTGNNTPYLVHNSAIINNSTGWQNTMGSGNTLYWVGGAGNWSDTLHWANASGVPGSGGCLPTLADDVIFDGQSGFTSTSKTVTISGTSAVCNNMTWHNMTEDLPTLAFTGDYANIIINHSLEWQQGMTINGSVASKTSYPYRINMQTSAGDATLTNKGVVMPELRFTGSGTLTVQDELSITGDFVHSGTGTVNVLNDMQVLGQVSMTGSSATLNIDNIDAQWGSFAATGSLQTLSMSNSTVQVNVNPTNINIWNAAGLTALQSTNSTLLLNGNNAAYNVMAGTNTSRPYHNIIFLKSGAINTPLKADSLMTGATGITLNLAANIEVDEYLGVKDCRNLTLFKSNSAVQRTVAFASGAVIDMDHAQLSYLNFYPPRTVNNCMDGGNNTGITFANVGSTYYWVKGAGDWSDLSHWDVVSGGLGNTGCVPMPGDNVVFDDLSGFNAPATLVTVTSAAYCRDMTWHKMTSNFPRFEINKAPLNIYGSLEWQKGMSVVIQNAENSTIRFLSSGADSIISNGVTVQGKYQVFTTPQMLFDNPAGTWTIKDDFKVEGSVRFLSGNLIMSGINAAMGGFISIGTASRNLDISNSVIRINDSHHYAATSGTAAWYTATDNLNLNAAGSAIHMEVLSDDYNNSFISKAEYVFSKIIFETNGSIKTVTTDTLIMKENGGISLNPTNTTVNKYFESLHCSGYNRLPASYNINYKLTMGAGATVNVDHLNINMAITGPDTPYAARGSLNPSDYAGWDLSESKDLYWVGGAGNWNDVSHWASASDGEPGSGCIPSQADNVFFDDNSGFNGQADRTVFVNSNVYCNNMTWHKMDNLDKPVLGVSDVGGSYTINIYGSLEFQQGMTISTISPGTSSYAPGGFYMRASGEANIKTNGVVSIHPYTFNGTGTWTLLDDLTVTNSFTLTSGNLIMNGKRIATGAFSSTGSAMRSLDIRNSRLYVSTWTYTGSNNTLLADSSNILVNGAFNVSAAHAYDTLTYQRKGTISDGAVLNTLILAQGFDGSNSTFAFPANGTVTVNNSIITNGTPCDMINIVSSATGTKANINVPASAYNIDTIIPVGFNLNSARIQDLNIVEGADKAKVRLTTVSYELAVGTNSGGWIIDEYKGLEGVSLGNDTSMWCNATFPINTDKFYGDENTVYLWNDNSTLNHLIITEFGDYWVRVNYSPGCEVSDTIHVDRTDDIHLSGTASPSGGLMKISLSVSGASSIDPNPVFVLDSVQPAGAISGLPLAQYSPDFYLSAPVKAFFSHTDSLAGCFDTWEMATPVMAVGDTALSVNGSAIDVALLRNDFTYAEGCGNISTALLPDFTAQHGTVELLDDTVRYTPSSGWEGIDSVYYILNVCGEKDTAAVYFITVKDTFDACPGVQISMTLPNISDMTYVWYDLNGDIVESSDTHTVTKSGAGDLGEWKIAATWNGYTFPLFSVYLVGSPTAAEHITVYGDTLIAANSATTLTLIASAEVNNPTFEWYTESVGGVKFNAGNVYTTSVLTADTTFYVAVSSANMCEGVERKAITVHVIPRPILVYDTCSTLMNTSLTYNVLANDTLPELCTEPEVIIDEISFDTNGTKEVLPDGSIKYTPSSGFTGRAVITYSVKCGNVTSIGVQKLSIIVSQPLSQKYIACENAIAIIGFHSGSGITYNWYDADLNPLKSNSDTLMVIKDDSPIQTYYVEPFHNANSHGCLFEVTLELNDNCGTTSPMAGCMTDGTIIWKEDFGGNDTLDPQLSPDPGWEGTGKTDYKYITNIPDKHIVNTGEYALLKSLDSATTIQPWTHNPEDHTYENDRSRGYFLTFDAKDEPVRYYEFEIHDLCPNMPLTFSAWIMNMLPKAFQEKYPAYVDPSAAFVIRDMNGNVLSTFFTNTLPATEEPEWKNYSFPFTVPAGITDLQVRIMNNQFASAVGNNMTFDDLEVRFCVPPVVVLSPADTMDTTLCVGTFFDLEASFHDDGSTFGPNLAYRWERNLTGDPADWTTIDGSEGVSTNGEVTSAYSFAPVVLGDTGYYRMVVSSPASINTEHCRAISDIIRLRTSNCLTSVTIGSSDTICYNTVPAEQKLLTVLPAEQNFTYQWMESVDGSTWNPVSGETTKDYAPPALKQTTMYRLTVSTGALEIHSNVDTVHVLPASLLNYPDIRIRACHDAGTVINMSKYLDTFDLKSVVWTTADGSVTTDEIGVGQLAAHGTYTYNYTVTNSCVADIKRKVYINMINNGDKFRLPKDTVVVCYEHAEALQINQLFGIEAGGSLKYADNIKSYIKQSATYGGAITMDGTGIYADTSIPFSDYHGVGNVKKIEFTYEDSAGCLQGKTYKIVIVLTPNINP